MSGRRQMRELRITLSWDEDAWESAYDEPHDTQTTDVETYVRGLIWGSAAADECDLRIER